MSSQGPERRLHPRVPFHAEARLFAGETDLGRFSVQNISAGGALVIGDTQLSFGLHVRVMMIAPQFGSLRLEADVVRVQAYGRGFAAGIAFRRPPLQIAQMIEEVVLNELAALERASQGTDSTS